VLLPQMALHPTTLELLSIFQTFYENLGLNTNCAPRAREVYLIYYQQSQMHSPVYQKDPQFHVQVTIFSRENEGISLPVLYMVSVFC
jgi:hypothetical protein